MKTLMSALALALLAPVLVATAETSDGKNPQPPVVVSCPDLSCCPPNRVCVYVGPIIIVTCGDQPRSPKC